jgi:periplasmic divalent cation tolerance protein
MVLIYTTCKNTEEAVQIGSELIKQKLAAAVNLWPIQNLKQVDGGVKSELHAALLIHTTEPRMQEIEDVITKHRHYTTPYVGAIDIRRFNRPYRQWMFSVIKQ